MFFRLARIMPKRRVAGQRRSLRASAYLRGVRTVPAIGSPARGRRPRRRQSPKWPARQLLHQHYVAGAFADRQLRHALKACLRGKGTYRSSAPNAGVAGIFATTAAAP